MVLHIDYENLESLLKTCSYFENGSNLPYQDLLTSELVCYIHTSNQDSLLSGDSKVSIWYRLNVNNKNIHLESPITNLKDYIEDATDFKERQKRLRSVYLLSNKEELKNVEHLKEGVLIGGLGEEQTILSKLFVDKAFSKQRRIGKINAIRKSGKPFEWEPLPATDIVIHDKYLFSDTTKEEGIKKGFQSFIKLWKSNEYKLSKRTLLPLNIVCFGLDANKFYKRKTALFDIVKNEFEGKREVNITYVRYLKETMSQDHDRYIRLQDHDRFILTNYFRFDFGDSLNNLFNSRSNSDLRSIFLSSTAKHLYDDQFYDDYLNKLQKDMEDIAREHPELIDGDKKSNFIDFSKIDK